MRARSATSSVRASCRFLHGPPLQPACRSHPRAHAPEMTGMGPRARARASGDGVHHGGPVLVQAATRAGAAPEIERGILSIEEQIAEHESKIANPESHIPERNTLDPRQRNALVTSKWPGDIAPDGTAAAQPVRVELVKAFGAAWLLIASEIGPDSTVDARAALAHNARLAIGALAVDRGTELLVRDVLGMRSREVRTPHGQDVHPSRCPREQQCLRAGRVEAQVDVSMPTIHFDVEPHLVVVRPGLMVVQDRDEEIFFTGSWYWYRRGPVWYRTRSCRGGWVIAPRHAVPAKLMRMRRCRGGCTCSSRSRVPGQSASTHSSGRAHSACAATASLRSSGLPQRGDCGEGRRRRDALPRGCLAG